MKGSSGQQIIADLFEIGKKYKNTKLLLETIGPIMVDFQDPISQWCGNDHSHNATHIGLMQFGHITLHHDKYVNVLCIDLYTQKKTNLQEIVFQLIEILRPVHYKIIPLWRGAKAESKTRNIMKVSPFIKVKEISEKYGE
jgi:hypothetical protein